MIIAALYLFLITAKAALALRYSKRQHVASYAPLTIVQPILSGDRLLQSTLEQNLKAHPNTQFLWMIDEDDSEAQRIAIVLARPNLRVALCRPPQNGENPKLAKLIRALDMVTTDRLMVLDDDTVFPGDLPAGALVTGLPVFTSNDTIYERLIGGFVNGSALLTYLPAAQLKLQRTINGMIYSVDAVQLRALGGFEAAGHELTDDYAVARLYARSGLAIMQSTAPALVSMTVTTPTAYIRVMRRWMIFATRYFGDNATLASMFWIALPQVLPFIGFALNPAAWTIVIPAKALLNRVLLWRMTRTSSTPLDIAFECVGDLLTPLWILLAFIQPTQLTWRTRKISMENGSIRYK